MSVLLGLINSFCSLFKFKLFFFSLYHGLNRDMVKVCVILSLYTNDLHIIKGSLHKVTEGARWGVKNRTDFILLSYLALTPGQVGLVLSLALTFTGMFQLCVRQRTEVENLVMFILTFLALSSLLAIKWHKSNSYVKY